MGVVRMSDVEKRVTGGHNVDCGRICIGTRMGILSGQRRSHDNISVCWDIFLDGRD
jgi:hypothetical protein